MEIHTIRKDYKIGSLDTADVLPNPISQFKKWFDEALIAQVNEPNAMTLSTVTSNLKPHSRIVLVKDINEKGLTFFTNYLSNKGIQLAHNPFASLLFFWPELERQIRFEGTIEKVSREESEKYFHSRPRESQIGAHVSPQSKAIPDRKYLEILQAELEKKFENKEIPLPDYWGGYLLKPEMIEFWQGRPGRLHDRICYSLKEENEWQYERLAP